MKKILCGTVAALAIVGMASPAAARTNEKHYAGTGDVNISVLGFNVSAPVNYTFTNPQPTNINPIPPSVPILGTPVMANVGEFLGEAGINLGVGTRYTVQATGSDDSETATPTVDVQFAMSGEVNKDCSFYSGNGYTDNVRNIDLGVIGVKTGNNENVGQAFEMTGNINVDIQTLTAGCNFNNRVTITKDKVAGLVNTAPGSYDTDEFRANIPYTVSASWQGVPRGGPAAGSTQNLSVGDNSKSGFLLQGAWRSQMDINITAAALSDKGLVAGTYEGTTTLTLSAS